MRAYSPTGVLIVGTKEVLIGRCGVDFERDESGKLTWEHDGMGTEGHYDNQETATNEKGETLFFDDVGDVWPESSLRTCDCDEITGDDGHKPGCNNGEDITPKPPAPSATERKPTPNNFERFDHAQEAFQDAPAKETAGAYLYSAIAYYNDDMIGDDTFLNALAEIRDFLLGGSDAAHDDITPKPPAPSADERATVEKPASVKIELAIVHLKVARDLLKEAEAPNAANRTRWCLKSAEGALRHAIACRDNPRLIRRSASKRRARP